MDPTLIELGLKHWPFIAVACVLAIVGQFFSLRVFTKENAYAVLGDDLVGRWAHRFMWWGRETLPMHPIAAGFVIGRCWLDPAPGVEGKQASMWYFALAGFASLGVWVYLKSKAKAQGVVLELPGESVPPLPIGAVDDLPPAEEASGSDDQASP